MTKSPEAMETDTRGLPLLTPRTREKWMDRERPERPEEKNNMTMTTVQMVNSMLGSGILSFPYVLSETGIVLSAILLIMFAYLNYAVNIMLLETGAHVGMKTGDQSHIIATALKSEFAGRLMDLCIAVMAFGSLLSYFNVMGNLGADLFKSTRPPDIGFNTYPGTIVITGILLSPFCFYRAYGDIAYVSLISWSLIFLTTIIIVVKGIAGHNSIPWWPSTPLAPIAMFGNFAFATSNQYVVHEAYASMRAELRENMGSIVTTQISLGVTLLTLMGLGGVAAVGADNLSTNIIDTLSLHPLLNKLLRIWTIFHLMMYIPNDFIIMRLYGCRYFDLNPLQIPFPRYVALTSILLAIPAILMAAIPRPDVTGAFELVITLTGDIPVAIGVFLLPLLAFKRRVLDNLPIDGPSFTPESLFPYARQWHVSFYFLLVLTLITLFVAPIVVLYDFATDCNRRTCASYGSS